VVINPRRNPQALIEIHIAGGMKRFRIKLTSGEHADRYIGQSSSSGLVPIADMQNDPPADIPLTKYGPYRQDQNAIHFFEHGAYQAFVKLRALGYEIEMVEVKGRACGAD
jgi:hypothetical protein